MADLVEINIRSLKSYEGDILAVIRGSAKGSTKNGHSDSRTLDEPC